MAIRQFAIGFLIAFIAVAIFNDPDLVAQIRTAVGGALADAGTAIR